jgi:hypothetical protein
MESDIVVAIGRATVDGHTLFRHCSRPPSRQWHTLRHTLGRKHSADEKLQTQFLELPQSRQTYTVLGGQPEGQWGYDFGINECQLAAGRVALRPTLASPGPCLLGTDLVRLVLERCHTAMQAVDLLTGLIQRFGQGAFPSCPAHLANDNAFVLADPEEAYAIEAAGSHWVYQEIHEVRAVSNVRVVRQDWDRISSGLADQAIDNGWWPADGRKLDFAGALLEDHYNQSSALRRWGCAALSLQEQNGHIDTEFMRRLATDDDEESCTASFIGRLTAGTGQPAMAWCAFGEPSVRVYMPMFLDGELPLAFSAAGHEPAVAHFQVRVQRLGAQVRRTLAPSAPVRDALARLQARFELEADEFLAEAIGLKQRDCPADLQRQATFFMQHNVELFEQLLAELLSFPELVSAGS